MATKILIKRSEGATAIPVLAYGELGVNLTTKKFWVGTNENGGGLMELGGEGHVLMLNPDEIQSPTGTYDFSGGTLKAATQNSSDSSTNVATTAFVTSKLIGGGSGINITGPIEAVGTTGSPITSTITDNAVTLPKLAQVATKTLLGNKELVTGNVTALTATEVKALLNINADSDIANFDANVQTNRLDQMAVPTGPVSLNGQKITGLAAPADAGDAANKGYVDGVAQGLDFKQSVKTISRTNIALSNLQTITNYTLQANDRILVQNQTTGSENGLYLAKSGPWDRTDDGKTGKLSGGALVYIEDGDSKGQSWVLATAGNITVGTQNQTWTQFASGELPGGGTLLAVEFGGTGRSDLTANALLTGDGTNPVKLVNSSTNGSVLVWTASGPAFAGTLNSQSLTIDGGTFTA